MKATKITKYQCFFCGNSFSKASNLKNHIHTIHEGHKDYKCDSCGKAFSEVGKLKKHNSCSASTNIKNSIVADKQGRILS